MRISRMEDFGGNWPAVNPSMYICPPFGPTEGPARASRSDCNWSGSSGKLIEILARQHDGAGVIIRADAELRAGIPGDLDLLFLHLN